MEREFIIHSIEPVFNADSKVLILGTMPSPKSRETGFYYGHPQNRFWPVIAAVLQKPCPQSPMERRCFALENKIAIWDVLASCSLRGADDSSIIQPEANDLDLILAHADIKAVFTTGAQAYKLYRRLCQPKTGRDAIALPSTSPANCRMSMEGLISKYKEIIPFLNEQQKG